MKIHNICYYFNTYFLLVIISFTPSTGEATRDAPENMKFLDVSGHVITLYLLKIIASPTLVCILANLVPKYIEKLYLFLHYRI